MKRPSPQRDNKGETLIDIARRSGACAEIIGLLSLTPEEARSLDWEGMGPLHAPVAYWMEWMVLLDGVDGFMDPITIVCRLSQVLQ